MPGLDEYRRKRDFSRTAEPTGSASSSGDQGRTYVVHKHDASHLHWDLRLEAGGVLLSWAIPKGPSLDPSAKRLAVHVEDHPVEYASFEGVIPEDQYGGGTVMVWDRGSWELEGPADATSIASALDRGQIKFRLHGERLRGRWMLVRTKGYGSRTQDTWLLIKERDDEARPTDSFDAIAVWTTSVVTGRSMAGIAADTTAVWHSDETAAANLARLAAAGGEQRPLALHTISGAAAAPFPTSIDVQLATLVERPPEGDNWFHEIKFDGYRIVAFLKNGRVRLVSRNGNDWTSRFPAVAQDVAGLPAATAVLDGEIVAMNPDGRSDFQTLQNYARSGTAGQLQYLVFDLVYLDGHDLRDAILADRKQLLDTLLKGHTAGTLRYSDHVEGHGEVFRSGVCDFALEGVVSKRPDSKYRSGRSRDWLKSKCLSEQEFVVVGFTDPQGSRTGFGALLLAVQREGSLTYAGRVGTGFTQASLDRIGARLAELEIAAAPLRDPPTGLAAVGVHWVRPMLVAEVSFSEWTAEGQLRHPVFKGLREDKAAADVVREEPADLDEPQPAIVVSAASAATTTRRPGGS